MDTPVMDELLEVYIENTVKDKNPKVRDIVKSKLLENIKEEIIKLEKQRIMHETNLEKEEIIEETKKEKKRIIDEGKKEFEKSKAMYAIEKAKGLFRDGVIVAFIIGLLVNQFTDLITPFKGLLGKSTKVSVVIFTFLIVLILIFIIDRMLKKYYFDKLADLVLKRSDD